MPGSVDTGDRKFPHVESIKLWFLDNPRYEERASGPRLCAELTASGLSDAAVTFVVWGNRINGLHGYDLASISVRSKPLALYGSESGGFHDDTPHYGTSTAGSIKSSIRKYTGSLNVFEETR